MFFRSIGPVIFVIIGCLMTASCVQDTPKSMLQNSDEYASRVIVPSELPGSVRQALMKPNEKQLPFGKITLKRKANVMVEGNSVSWSSDMVYENAGNGLVRQIETEYRNGIETITALNLSYHGIYPLLHQTINASNTKTPYMTRVVSISHIDLALDKTSFDYVYSLRSSAPRTRLLDESMSCQLTSTKPASSYIPNVPGDAKEFSCKVFNSNGVAQRENDLIYLIKYDIAIVKVVKESNLSLYWSYSDFKLE